MRRIVIGVGNPYRGDDGIGPLVLARLGDLVGAEGGSSTVAVAADGAAGEHRAGPPAAAREGVELVPSDGEPTRLLEAWEGADVAVVVDAARSGSVPPGTLRREEPTGTPPGRGARRATTHALGVADALALGAALDRLPRRLVVYSVEGAAFGLGDPMSPSVAAAADRVAAAILGDLGVPGSPRPREPAEEGPSP